MWDEVRNEPEGTKDKMLSVEGGEAGGVEGCVCGTTVTAV